MKISVLNGADAPSYQEVRLDGLRRDPHAFGSTYDREVKFSLETVTERIQPSRDKFVLGGGWITSWNRNLYARERHEDVT